MNIVISAEATCDLDAATAKKYGISVAPMSYCVGNDCYDTVTGLAPSECYKRMRAGALTSTALINETNAAEYFENLLKQGADVVHLGFSSTLSGTYLNMAAAAETLRKKYPSQKLAVIDTACGSFGQGLLAIMAAELAARGATFEEVAFFAENHRMDICHFFIAEDLTYLSRSGRIPKILAAIGNAIRIKPLMFLDKDGRFSVAKKVLTRKKSVYELADSVIENYSGEHGLIIVGHADCLEEAQETADRIERGLHVKPVIMEFGMMIGGHCGPGTVGAFYTGKKRGK